MPLAPADVASLLAPADVASQLPFVASQLPLVVASAETLAVELDSDPRVQGLRFALIVVDDGDRVFARAEEKIRRASAAAIGGAVNGGDSPPRFAAAGGGGGGGREKMRELLEQIGVADDPAYQLLDNSAQIPSPHRHLVAPLPDAPISGPPPDSWASYYERRGLSADSPLALLLPSR